MDKIDFSKIDYNKVAPIIKSEEYNKVIQSILDGYEPMYLNLTEEKLEELFNLVVEKINRSVENEKI